jgi:hypothetical protein
MSAILLRQVSNICDEALVRIQSARTGAGLDTVRREVLGKSGALPGPRRGVGSCRPRTAARSARRSTRRSRPPPLR